MPVPFEKPNFGIQRVICLKPVNLHVWQGSNKQPLPQNPAVKLSTFKKRVIQHQIYQVYKQQKIPALHWPLPETLTHITDWLLMMLLRWVHLHSIQYGGLNKQHQMSSKIKGTSIDEWHCLHNNSKTQNCWNWNTLVNMG